MQTPQETWTFQRQRAEVPHGGVAVALTGCDADEWRDELSGHPAEMEPLVQRAMAGDQAALDSLFIALRPRAMAIAVKVLRNTDDAEDAVQEAFVKLWRSLPRFEGRSSFSTWAHRIVRNASLDILRRADRRPVGQADADRQPEQAVERDSQDTPESALAAREVQSLVRNAIRALPHPHRQAVELRELEERSYEEMAEIIQCPVGTVMSRLHHARHRLARDLRLPCAEAFALAAA